MKEQILELRAKGYSYRKIQSELGCSKSTISYHCGSGQKEKLKKRSDKYKEEFPFLKKAENFDLQYRDKNVMYSQKRGYCRKKLKDYLSTVDKCYLTGREIDTDFTNTYQFDHIIPRSRGGDNSFENLGIATPDANRAKHNLSVEEFIQLSKDILENFGYKVTK
jgi:CRISPR/Cas system Type II protein with McrA/HNH and RuvC-like nuclease domain